MCSIMYTYTAKPHEQALRRWFTADDEILDR